MRRGLKKLRNILKGNNGLYANISYLSLLQVFNLIAPLLTLPYLIKTLGSSLYGELIYAQAIVYYALVFISFGFDISGAKHVSVHRNDKKKLGEIVSSIFLIKVLFFCSGLLVLVGLYVFKFITIDSFILIGLTTWIIFYDIFFPKWFFQGIEEMKNITLISLSTRLVFIGLIFLKIKDSDDYLLVPILNGLGVLLGVLISTILIFGKYGIKFEVPSCSTLLFYMKDSSSIFLSTLAINLYKGATKLLVGIFVGMQEVAYYDLADKIVTLAKTPQNILSQAIFPRISQGRNILYLKGLLKYVIALNSVIAIVVYGASFNLVGFLGSDEMVDSVVILKILIMTVPLLGIGNIYGIQFLIGFGHNRDFSMSVLTGLTFYIVQLVVLFIFGWLTIYSLTFITVTTEVVTTTSVVLKGKKRNF